MPEPAPPTPTDPAAPARRGRRRLRWVAGGLLVGAPVAAELACRFVLGLGDPPLYTRDAQIEYLPTPGRYARFGHTVSYNSASMRATPELAPKPAPGERRVLVLGDSVPNAGAKLDDREVGTVALQTLLNAADAGGAAPAERWTVLNASSGSWGPPNLLAYARRFGLFGADTVVIVLNDGDAWDVPTFAGSLGPDFPERRPVLALGEAFGRYLPRLLARIRPSATGAPAEPAPGDLKASLSALRELIELARASGAGVAVVLHADRDELTRGPGEGTGLLEAACRGLGVPVFSTAPAMRAALKAGSGPYDGSIHLTASGQGVLAGVMLEAARASAAPAR